MCPEFRKIFDTIPDQFDRWRPRYTPELFSHLIEFAHIDKNACVLELGPGTGQATEPILRTGCQYHAIELGENLAAVLQRKYSSLDNFHLLVDDFITHDFGPQQFDTVYSAATIQWIPEEIAFSKVFQLLKPGGTLAMMLTRGDYKTPNEELFQRIQQVYSAHFRPLEEYKRGFRYRDCLQYGFTDFQQLEFHGVREMTADEYVAFCGTHCDHLVIHPAHRQPFFEGLHAAVMDAGNKIVFHDTHVLMTVKKPP